MPNYFAFQLNTWAIDQLNKKTALSEPGGGTAGDSLSQVFVYGKGRKFDTWVRSPLTTSDLIEGPGYIVESIFRDELGLGSSLVNSTSFDALGATGGVRDYATWKYARSLPEEVESPDVVAQLCYEGAMVSLRDYQNKEKIVAIDYNAPSDATAITTSDILEDNGRPIVRASQTSIREIRNEFYLNYKFNYGTGKYDKQLFITASNDNLSTATRDNTDGNGATYQALCSNSQSYYNKVERWTFNANWIRSATTAENFIKYMANWLTIRKWKINATLIYNASTLRFELMDTCFWNITLLPSSVRSVNGFLITRLIDGGLVKPNTIDIETIQVPTWFGTGGYGFGYGDSYGIQL